MFDSFKKLMQPEFDEAEARGEARGITKGANLFGEILLAFNKGQTKAQLLEDGYSEDLINQAEQLYICLIHTKKKNK